MFGAGFVSSAVVGYLTIKFFLRFVADHSLRAFAYYLRARRARNRGSLRLWFLMPLAEARSVREKADPQSHGAGRTASDR
jgi:hypothetical protein